MRGTVESFRFSYLRANGSSRGSAGSSWAIMVVPGGDWDREGVGFGAAGFQTFLAGRASSKALATLSATLSATLIKFECRALATKSTRSFRSEDGDARKKPRPASMDPKRRVTPHPRTTPGRPV